MSDGVEIGRFAKVDDCAQADLLVAFLDFFERLPGMPELRRRSYELLGDVTGKSVLDVGCGTGGGVADLAVLGAKSCGVDASERLVSIAAQRYPGNDFRVGLAESLAFDSGSIDLFRAERVFQHLKDPQVGLEEARRVLGPGGRLVLIDFDVETWAADAADMEVTRSLARGFAATVASPWIGRRYRALLLDAGFVEVVVELQPFVFTNFAEVAPLVQSITLASVACGATTHEEATAWLIDQQERSERDRMFMAVPMFVASASTR